MILGIDLGASSADFVLFRGREIVKKKSLPPVSLEELPKRLTELGFPINRAHLIAITGGKSPRAKKSYYGIPVRKVGEISAIGEGGLFVSGKKKALVVSLGTGTCIVEAAKGKSMHCAGTGVSGGTLIGLSKRMLGVSDWKKLARLAKKGSLKKVDLLVKDITGEGIGKLPGSATASNFAKQGKAARKDIALGIINLVAEVNAVAIALASEKSGNRAIVLTGKLLSIPIFRRRLLAGLKTLGAKAIVPHNYGIAAALGACVSAQNF